MAKLSFLAVVAASFLSAVAAQAHAGCEIRDGVEFCPSASADGKIRLVAQVPTRTTHFPRDIVARATGSSADAAVTGCHNHGSDVYCIDGDGHEVSVSLTATPTGEIPAQYTGCHSHGSDRYVVVLLESMPLLTIETDSASAPMAKKFRSSRTERPDQSQREAMNMANPAAILVCIAISMPALSESWPSATCTAPCH